MEVTSIFMYFSLLSQNGTLYKTKYIIYEMKIVRKEIVYNKHPYTSDRSTSLYVPISLKAIVYFVITGPI